MFQSLKNFVLYLEFAEQTENWWDNRLFPLIAPNTRMLFYVLSQQQYVWKFCNHQQVGWWA